VNPLPATGYQIDGSFWNRIGFHFKMDRFSDPEETEAAFTLIVPLWLPLWLSAAPLAFWILRANHCGSRPDLVCDPLVRRAAVVMDAHRRAPCSASAATPQGAL
jgi:hypothetical protein